MGARCFEAAFAGQRKVVGDARRFVRNALAEVAGLPAGLVDDAVTCVSELATNAIEHTASGRPGGKFVVRLQIAGPLLQVEVVDQGAATVPAIRVDAAEDGRGLFIAAALGSLGQAPDPDGGRRVWVWLSRPALPDLSSDFCEVNTMVTVIRQPDTEADDPRPPLLWIRVALACGFVGTGAGITLSALTGPDWIGLIPLVVGWAIPVVWAVCKASPPR